MRCFQEEKKVDRRKAKDKEFINVGCKLESISFKKHIRDNFKAIAFLVFSLKKTRKAY